ncbi:Tn3 family transposase [Candidatus Tisiphia endosymbiont of Nedyus quadrimaculatus]|uniref:Tn3 family transposase n=1 Tax=Candidatus Tisiphia endosymbiont of Nedyus quadrimaculatus TaxID=3139332 RepID=UPI00345E5D1B
MQNNLSQHNNILDNEAIFTLDSEEIALAQGKNTQENKLAFAVMLKFFQLEKRYPREIDVIPQPMFNSLAIQLDCLDVSLDNYNWDSRSSKRFRQAIRLLLGYRKASVNDSKKLIAWLIEDILPQVPTLPQITEQAYQFCTKHQFEPFKPAQLDRYIASACHRFEMQFFFSISQQLSVDTMNSIDALLKIEDDNETLEKESNDATIYKVNNKEDIIKRLKQIQLRHLKKDIAGAKLKNVSDEIDKLKRLRILNLPSMLSLVPRKLKQKYYTRICAELPSEIEDLKTDTHYATMAIFCHFRCGLITDNLVTTLIQLIHKIRTSAEISVNKDILSEVKCVNGKFDILYTLADTSIAKPHGVIHDTIYPKVSKETLSDLAKELVSNKNSWYQSEVQKKMHSSYSHANRRILLMLLEIFTFRSNNQACKAILQAIEFIKTNKNIKDKYYPDSKLVPAKEDIPSKWQATVIEEQEVVEDSKKNNINKVINVKINRMSYEVAILETLHNLLDTKQIWVEGAYRYRNPEEDLPKDFDSNAQYYYQKLGLPMDGNEFIQSLQDSLDKHLQEFNKNICDNKKVKIAIAKNSTNGHIKLTPYDAQIEPTNLLAFQQSINKRWGTINLIDVLKEADSRIGFTKHFHTVASRKNIKESKLLKRILLSLYAIGSNTGLKRISAANDEINYSDLRYIKRRYLNTANVREATAEVINAILETRDSKIWGDATTGCACDSTKVSSWDQNLMTEWHTRYKGRGVMIYWHVDKNAACIYSQLKTCSSSEVGSMIKGVLDHSSKMDMKKTYVDTHGQSIIGFACSYLLTFDLLPRLKNIKKQKLFYSHAKDRGNYKNLTSILESSINWSLIKKYYHEVIRYIAALRTGHVEPEVMFKILSNSNNDHPVYKTLIEIGRAVKTIFLSRYLMSEELRIEIHEALNVVERLNSIMGFIFYGKLGEISTNNRDDQELAIVCLHLLQVCMVYINTLIIQEVLSDPVWQNKLTIEDKRALSPLIHSHINPYGLFPLDMDKRLIIEQPKVKVAA